MEGHSSEGCPLLFGKVVKYRQENVQNAMHCP